MKNITKASFALSTMFGFAFALWAFETPHADVAVASIAMSGIFFLASASLAMGSDEGKGQPGCDRCGWDDMGFSHEPNCSFKRKIEAEARRMDFIITPKRAKKAPATPRKSKGLVNTDSK